MSEVKTVPIEAVVQMQATAPVQHMCPFIQEVDNGTVTVAWEAAGWTFELHSLRAYLETFAGREIAHEELTAEIQAELSGAHGINNVTVNSSWHTAGMEISCFTKGHHRAAHRARQGGDAFSTSPTRADPQ